MLEISKEIYNLELKVRVVESENDIPGGTAGPINLSSGLKSVVVKYRLDFDNRDYVMIHDLIDFNSQLLLISWFHIIICMFQKQICTTPDQHEYKTKQKQKNTIKLCNEIRCRKDFTLELILHN